MFIEVQDLKRISTEHGRLAGEQVLRHVVNEARAGLRVADILFRNSGDDFVAFLAAADDDTADMVANRIRERIARNPVQVAESIFLDIEATVTAAVSPRDGLKFADLFITVERRRHHGHSTRTSIH